MSGGLQEGGGCLEQDVRKEGILLDFREGPGCHVRDRK